MLKILSLMLCFAILFSLVACSDTKSSPTSAGDDVTDSTTTTAPSESACQHEYKEEVQKEAGYGYDGYKVKYCTICHDTEYVAIPALPDIFEIKAIDKTTYEEDGTGYIIFDLEITNTSDKRINSIAGTLSVVFEGSILELNYDLEALSLEAYSSVVIDSYGYDFDFDSPNEAVSQKVYEAELEDLSFRFTPTDVITE